MTEDTGSQRSWPRPLLAWFAASVLFLAYTVAFIDRSILALIVEPLRHDLAINDTQVGLLAGLAFVIFYVGLGVPLGLVADHTKRQLLVIISVVVCSLMTAACGLAQTFDQLFIARIGVGIGEAGLSPASYSFIADLFPANRRGAPLGLYSTGIYFGSGLAMIVGGAVIARVHQMSVLQVPLIGSIHSWQIVFFVVALPGLLVALLMTTVSEPERRTDKATDERPSLSETFAYIRARGYLYLMHFLGFGFVAAPSSILFLWLRPYLTRRFGISPADAGYWVGLLLIVCAIPGMLLGSIAGDVMQSRRIPDATIRVALAASLALIVPFAVLGALPTAPLALCDIGIMLFLAASPFGVAAAALQLVTPNRMRGLVSGLYLLAVNLIGATAGPAITGMLTDYVFHDAAKTGWSISIVGSVSALVATVLFFLLRRPFLAGLSPIGTTLRVKGSLSEVVR
ncbi:MAG: MFS transporter [Steroidobacteraceae bacterium]